MALARNTEYARKQWNACWLVVNSYTRELHWAQCFINTGSMLYGVLAVSVNRLSYFESVLKEACQPYRSAHRLQEILWGSDSKSFGQIEVKKGVIWVMFLGCEWRGRPTALTPNISAAVQNPQTTSNTCCLESQQSHLEFKVLQQCSVSSFFYVFEEF